MPSLFEDLIQNIPAIFYRCQCDKNWTIHFLNEAIEPLSGYPASDFVNNQVRTFTSIIHPEDVDYVDVAVNKAVDQHRLWTVEYRLITSEGTVKWVSETGIGVFSATGELECLDGFIYDISIRKQLMLDVAAAQDSLTDSENFFRALMQTAADPIIVISQKGLLEEFNSAAELVFGYQAGQVIGHNVKILMPDEYAVKHDGYLQSYLQTREAKVIGVGREVQGKRKDGSLFPMHLSVSEISTVGGLTRFAGIVRDLTSQKLLESELSKAHKMEAIGQLAAGIAHEINTPAQFIGDNLRFLTDAFKELSELVALSQQLVEQHNSAHETSFVVEAIQKKIESSDLQYLLEDIPESLRESTEGMSRISEIVKAMKEFSHPGGKSKESIDLEKMIESTLIVARNEWKYLADVKTDFAEGLPMVECLPGEISQAVLNVIVNAAHAIESKQAEQGSSDKGVIRIKTFQEGQYCVIEISDTGCGISQKHLNKVFDPFFTTKEVGRGTGQGLSMVYATITDKHNGKIEVDSTPGVGTTMSIKLP